jgi:hypothetical protein
MALLNFDASKIAPSKPLDPVPSGWYDAKIIGSELKPTANGSGTRLNLTFEIIGGEFNGRKVFDGLNIKNESSKAQEIAQSQLSAICHAVNIMNLVQSEQLHGHPMKIKVRVKPATDGYDARNEISGYENINFKPATQGGPVANAGQKPVNQPPRPNNPAQQGGFGNRPSAPQMGAQQGFGNHAGNGQHRPLPPQSTTATATAYTQQDVAAQVVAAQVVAAQVGEQPWESQADSSNATQQNDPNEFSQDAPWGQ